MLGPPSEWAGFGPWGKRILHGVFGKSGKKWLTQPVDFPQREKSYRFAPGFTYNEGLIIMLADFRNKEADYAEKSLDRNVRSVHVDDIHLL